jgi:hypothetical protein
MAVLLKQLILASATTSVVAMSVIEIPNLRVPGKPCGAMVAALL